MISNKPGKTDRNHSVFKAGLYSTGRSIPETAKRP